MVLFYHIIGIYKASYTTYSRWLADWWVIHCKRLWTDCQWPLSLSLSLSIYIYIFCFRLYILFSSCQLALLGYPNWGFSRAFSSVVRQMRGYNSHRRCTICTLLKLIALFCVLFVCKCVLYCCHRVSTQWHLTNISYIMYLVIRSEGMQKEEKSRKNHGPGQAVFRAIF